MTHSEAQSATPFGTPLAAADLTHFKNSKFSLIFGNSTMRQLIDPLFTAAGFIPQLLIETSMNHALIQMTAKGLCCTILPYSRMLSSPYSSHCAWFKLPEHPTWQVCIAHRTDTHLNEAHKHFIHLAQHYGSNLQKRFI